MTKTPSDWAIDRALELCGDAPTEMNRNAVKSGSWPNIHAFACYIEENEPDPLLEDAREVCAAWFEARGDLVTAGGYREGSHDNTETIKITKAALRRGIELGREARRG